MWKRIKSVDSEPAFINVGRFLTNKLIREEIQDGYQNTATDLLTSVIQVL
jgi:hypothetical protein